jgi:peptidoglycan-associated lipoprotein
MPTRLLCALHGPQIQPSIQRGLPMSYKSVHQAFLIVLMGLTFVIGGCSKFLETQSGSKSTDPGRRARVGDLSTAPNLSLQVTPGDASARDLVIARAEPTPGSPEQLEQMRQDEIATAAAGLEDVFFEFDRWTISDQGRQALQISVEWLRSNPSKKLTIQGHCDERGTAAYNLVLGEKRARSIRQHLLDLGVKADRLRTVSYGKERPFCQERTEQCYQQNRRGHLSVQAR